MPVSTRIAAIFSAPQPAARADDVESRTAIRINWILIGAGALLLFAAASWSGFAWNAPSLAPLLGLNVILAVLAFVLRARGFPIFASLFQAIAQIALASTVASLMSVVLAGTAAPLQDTLLIEMDRWLGFDWKSMIAGFSQWPQLTLVLNYAYASLSYQPLALLMLLAAAGKGARGNILALAWTVTLIAAVAIFPFTPALGGYLHYGIGRAEVPEVQIAAAWLYVDVLEGARSGALRVLGSGTLDGVITFPSVHTAAAVLLAWGFYGLRWLRWPGVALNALMIASTPVIGGHYLIDVVVGAVIAVAAIWLANRLVREAGKEPITNVFASARPLGQPSSAEPCIPASRKALPEGAYLGDEGAGRAVSGRAPFLRP